MTDSADELTEVRLACSGNREPLGEILDRHRPRLLRVVSLRLDDRLHGRIDPGDVVQETFLEAISRVDDWLRDPAMPFFLWLRFLTLQQLSLAHRKHLGVQARDASREIRLSRNFRPEASSVALAAQLVGRLTSPSHAAMRTELKLRVQELLNGMPEIDREIIALRHFESLTNSEAARVLGLSKSAACNRYVRSLERLKRLLEDVPGLSTRSLE